MSLLETISGRIFWLYPLVVGDFKEEVERIGVVDFVIENDRSGFSLDAVEPQAAFKVL